MTNDSEFCLIPIDDNLKVFLDRQIKGTGGYQSLITRLQRQTVVIDNQEYLRLWSEDIKQIKRYREEYGAGGFQSLLKLLDIN